MDFLERCRQFIAVDSSPKSGTAEIGKVAAEFCQEEGLFVELQRETHRGLPQCNIIARSKKNKPEEELLLLTHLDTVDTGHFGLWSETDSSPFNATIKENRVYGLGSVDAKLDFLCKLEAAKDFREVDLKTPFVLVGTYGEELGMVGAMKLIRRNQVSSKRALIGGPTDLHIGHSGKGIAVVEVRVPFSEEEKKYKRDHDLQESSSSQSKYFHGKAAHSSDPSQGDNAVVKMIDYLSQLPESIVIMEMEGGTEAHTIPDNAVLEIDVVGGLKDNIGKKIMHIWSSVRKIEKDFPKYQDIEFTPPETTLNFGQVQTFEDEIVMSGGCRLPPTVPHEVYESWMETLEHACQEVGASFRIIEYKKPFQTDRESPFAKGCQAELIEMGMSGKFQAQSSTTEASVLSRMGIDCLAFGPGQTRGNAHSSTENVKIEDLHMAIDFYKRVIKRFCL